jgi:hypothetical protein
MRTLSRVQVTIEPTNYDPLALSFTAVTVTAIVNGQKYSFRQELLPDHINSLFDNIFDLAKSKIKEAILEQDSRVREG